MDIGKYICLASSIIVASTGASSLTWAFQIESSSSLRVASIQGREWSHRSILASLHDIDIENNAIDDDSQLTKSPSEDANNDDTSNNLRLTSAVFNVTYDGSHFSGWSSSNDDLSMSSNHADIESVDDRSQDDQFEYASRPNGAAFLPPLNSMGRKTTGRKRRRGQRIPGITQVRSVEGQIRKALAKVYGDVDPKRIQIEGCSRTDKGVHGRSMIALFYCLKSEAMAEAEARRSNGAVEKHSTCSCSDDYESGDGQITNGEMNTNGIPGKRMPHPLTPTDDASFEYLPFDGNIDKLMFVMNRMLPPDVRISNISPTPTKPDGELPFHPTLDAREKTYRYTFSIGHVHDPMRWRHVWHVDTYGKPFDAQKARECAKLFEGSHDFAAFRGAFRGNDRRRVQDDTICTLSSVAFEEELQDTVDCVGASPLSGVAVGGNNFQDVPKCGLEPLITYTVEITGDRFLYKMVRFIVGSIVSVGLGKIDVDDINDALKGGGWDMSMDSVEIIEERKKKQKKAAKKDTICAPSHGLVLINAAVDTSMDWVW